MTERKGTLFLKHTQVIIHWPDGREETVRLGNIARVGRGREGNDIAIPDLFQSISRRHFEIRREKEGYRLVDLGSRNGVLINGIYAKDSYLRDGDEIRVGQGNKDQEVRIEFQLGSESLLADLRADEHATLPPSSGLSSESPENTPYFKIRWHNGSTNFFPIIYERVIIGRGAEADLPIPETLRFVSTQQAEVLNTDAGFVIRDLNSANGTLLNNERLQPDQYYPLGNEAIIRFGDDEYGVSIGLTFINPLEGSDSVLGFIQSAAATQLDKASMILIGRLQNCDVILDNPEVSRRHAMIRQLGETYILEDLESSNGTYVNGERIKQVELQEGDLIQISKYFLLFQDGRLVPYESGGMRLDISGLSKDANGKRILDDVNFSVMPREFIALVGGNASGRPALLDALTGVHRADGHVMLNGYDFYREYESLRSHVGYVPQAETLHEGLTVEQVLDYATRLRLPSNLTREERTRLTDAALESISMNTDAIRRTRISDLPLDERKRIGIAVELLADPKIIYLDEIALGLDPGREKKMMYILRRMADEGRTVVLATHATNNLLQTDHAAILSEGKLVYFGPSNEALEFFEAEEFADIYEHIEQKGDEWRKVFEEKKPEQHKKYVQERKKNIPATPKRPLPKDTFGITSFFSQLLILTQRNWDVNKGDRVRLLLMFLLFPITALLQLTIARPDILTGNHAILADPVSAAGAMSASYAPFAHTNAFIFLMGFESVLAGMFLPLTDLTRERPIFLRECVINLRALSYLLSKVFIYIAFAIAQVFLYMLILSLGVDYPANGLSFSGGFEIYMTLFLAMATGISLGLLISAVSKSSETAIQIFMVVLIFQFLFAGALFDLQGNNLESLSNVTATRWAQTALGVTIDMNKIVEGTILCNEELDCFNYPAAKDDLSLNYDDGQLTRSWSALALMSILSLAMTWFLLRRIGSSAT